MLSNTSTILWGCGQESMNEFNDEYRIFFKNLIGLIEKDLCKTIETNSTRFPSCKSLLTRFRGASERLLSEGLKHLKSFIEFHNELCTAVNILESPPACMLLDYEPKSRDSNKRIDFRALFASGPPRWVEVKTIHPTNQDAWEKFVQHRDLQRFGKKVEVILEKERLGGELYHKAFASRSKMLEYTLETEKNIEAYIKDEEKGITFLMLCSNGFDWHRDRLEDFVFFYRYRKHFSGDPFRLLEEHYIKDKGIHLLYNINYFGFMERPISEIRPNVATWNIKPYDWPLEGLESYK